MRKIVAWLEIFRVSNLPTVWSNVGASWWISGGSNSGALAALLAGASLVYMAGMALNDVLDAAIDKRERPGRPIPSGRVSVTAVGATGLLLLGAGSGLIVHSGASSWLAGILSVAVIGYDWLHGKAAWTMLLMSLCRAILWLLPATLPGHEIGRGTIVWTIIMFFHVLGISLLARHEAGLTSCGRANLPVACGLLLLPLLGLAKQPTLGGALCALVFIGLLAQALRPIVFVREASIGRAVGWLLSGIPLVDAMAVGQLPHAIIIASAFMVCRVLGRYIPAS